MLTCVSSSEGNLFLELLAESVVAYTVLLDDEHTILDNLVNLNIFYVLNSGSNSFAGVELDLVLNVLRFTQIFTVQNYSKFMK